MDITNYSANMHSHRFSAWAAATGARTSPRCRFNVIQGSRILEGIGLNADLTLENLPSTDFDLYHTDLRNRAVEYAVKKEVISTFTHGVAAKIINIYLKARFICGSDGQNEKMANIHPPIDRVLLDKLIERKVGNMTLWKYINSTEGGGWSNLDSDKYQEAIDSIREYCL